MSKSSANRHRKQNSGGNKSANNAASTRPARIETKANGTVVTKPAETTAKVNGTTPLKSAPAATKPAETSAKTNGIAMAKPAPAATKPASNRSAGQGANPGSLKRAQQRKQQKTQNRLDQQREDARSRRITVFTIASVVVLVGALITWLVIQNNAAASPLAQAEQIVDANYQPVDGVYCDTLEQSVEHIHAHLSIYINSAPVNLVANTGIAPIGVTSNANVTCYYWLHTHDASGVIHIESPTKAPFTLNQFFDVWERFSSSTSPFPTQLLSSTGWIIYVNGKQVNTDFNHLQMHAHDLITIAYNSPGVKPDTTYSWGQL